MSRDSPSWRKARPRLLPGSHLRVWLRRDRTPSPSVSSMFQPPIRPGSSSDERVSVLLCHPAGNTRTLVVPVAGGMTVTELDDGTRLGLDRGLPATFVVVEWPTDESDLDAFYAKLGRRLSMGFHDGAGNVALYPCKTTPAPFFEASEDPRIQAVAGVLHRRAVHRIEEQAIDGRSVGTHFETTGEIPQVLRGKGGRLYVSTGIENLPGLPMEGDVQAVSVDQDEGAIRIVALVVPKADGGEMAVLYAPLGTAVSVKTADGDLSAVVQADGSTRALTSLERAALGRGAHPAVCVPLRVGPPPPKATQGGSATHEAAPRRKPTPPPPAPPPPPVYEERVPEDVQYEAPAPDLPPDTDIPEMNGPPADHFEHGPADLELGPPADSFGHGPPPEFFEHSPLSGEPLFDPNDMIPDEGYDMGDYGGYDHDVMDQGGFDRSEYGDMYEDPTHDDLMASSKSRSTSSGPLSVREVDIQVNPRLSIANWEERGRAGVLFIGRVLAAAIDNDAQADDPSLHAAFYWARLSNAAYRPTGWGKRALSGALSGPLMEAVKQVRKFYVGKDKFFARVMASGAVRMVDEMGRAVKDENAQRALAKHLDIPFEVAFPKVEHVSEKEAKKKTGFVRGISR